MSVLPALLLACGDRPVDPTDGPTGETGATGAPHTARLTGSTADTGHLPADADADGDGVSPPDDCDDADPGVTPDGPERCNGRDDDCDGISDEGFDLDGDGVGWCASDCNDWDPAVSPAAPEACNERDDDCDRAIDEGFDLDADGASTCGGDCDDADPARNPWAIEVCNGLDDDCDGGVDDAADADLDGYTCQPGAEDCDDTDPRVHPGAQERCDGVDGDCDGVIPPAEADGDLDGVRVCGGDCADADPAVAGPFPEACDGVDNDCDPLTLETEDQDRDGVSACDGDCDDGALVVGPGAAERCNGRDEDCDGAVDEGGACASCALFDTSEATYLACPTSRAWDAARADCRAREGELASVPSAGEAQDLGAGLQATIGNGSAWIGFSDVAAEGTFAWSDGSAVTYTAWNPFEPNDAGGNEDCTELYPSTGGWNDLPCSIGRPYACELCALGLDDDGDGATPCSGDCDERDPARHPGARERCDGVDEDCDGVVDDVPDDDGDGFVCAPGAEDCDDTDPSVHPGAVERCDGADGDCDGVIPLAERDRDADGARVCGGDCDDAEPAVAVGFPERCDGLDNDCDPSTDEATDGDGDGHATCGGDCDDAAPSVGPGAIERCDLSDDDCDGSTDEGGVCGSCSPFASADGVYLSCAAPLAWDAARAECLRLQGDLASVPSAAEGDALEAGLQPLVGNGSAWIGFSDQAVEGAFAWSDGSPVTYTAWNPFEPNDAGGNEDCAELYPSTGGWNDLPCSIAKPYVCELGAP